MILFEDVVKSFIDNMNDYLMIIVSFFGSLLLLLIGPFLNLINITKNKTKFGTPKTIVITGSNSGMGRGIAIAYAKPGVTLGLIGRNIERLQDVKNECIKKGANVIIESIDITDKEKMNNWLLSFDKKYTVDILIANAAVSELMLPKELNFNDRTYELTNINVMGMLNTALPLIENFEKRGNGQIVLVSSLTSYLNFVFPTYCGSKAFVTSFGLTLRNRLKDSGVGVSIIAPGFVDTPMSDSLKQDSLPFSVTPNQAATIILDGISKNKAFIAFSLPTLLFTYFVNIIPPNLKDSWNYISTFFFKHPEFNTPNTSNSNSNNTDSSSSKFKKN
ncbi:hypothetical protein ACTFIR_001831 [Dictyostelium discoideum]